MAKKMDWVIYRFGAEWSKAISTGGNFSEQQAESFRQSDEQFYGGIVLKRLLTAEERQKNRVSQCPNHPGYGNATVYPCGCRECTEQPDSLVGVVLSPWLVVDGFCATRVIAGSDPAVVANRVAFIEKTPRVLHNDEWVEGPKGAGGENARENGYYGFYQPSRDWCDAYLTAHGAVLQ